MTGTRDFDAVAATWDEEPRRVRLAGDVAAAIIRQVQPTREMDAMDYGCGTGLLTLLLQPHVGTITGVDSSAGMLAVLQEKVRQQGITNVRTLLCETPDPGLPEGACDLVVSSMVLHHVADTAALFRRLATALRPNGVICLADLDTEDGRFHSDRTGVFHFGFDRRELQRLLVGAGFSPCSETTASVVVKQQGEEERRYPVFLLTAQKPPG
jgi:ubiquinone/menaquinone biosynthesis C-methylase UbiE